MSDRSAPGTLPVRDPDSGQPIGGLLHHPHQSPRPAWIEIYRDRLERNLRRIRSALPPQVRWLVVVKANAYGHGILTVARAAVAAGADYLGVATLDEGTALRHARIEVPILLLGERHPEELPSCLQYRLAVSIGNLDLARQLSRLARDARVVAPVHLKVNTGMNRYGVPWETAADTAAILHRLPGLLLEGTMSHFAMSDETDKTFAREQLRRFEIVTASLKNARVPSGLKHLCNTGGFLDLPEAHLDMVRLGLLPLGVYPSAVCQRLPDLEPVMTVKARFTAVQNLQPGDTYGYGLRYRATGLERIGVLPLGYGDGYPRIRNLGHVLVGGCRAPLVGGVAMDAIGVNLTHVPQVGLWDEAVLLGRQGAEEISARTLADWGNTVCYDLLAGWRSRLPRIEMAA